MKERFRAYIAVYLVLEEDGKILMGKRQNTDYQNGSYSLVSGHLEGGESSRDGLIREVKEEIGIDLEKQDLEVIHVLHRYRTDREYFCIFIKASKYEGGIVNLEPEKCAELAWLDKNNLPENIAPEVKLALDKIEEGEFFNEDGFGKK